MSEMAIVKVKLSDLHPDPANTRVHSQRNIEVIKSSLLEHSQYLPLVVQKSTMKILVGNGRFEAIRQLREEARWESDEVICNVVEIDDVKAAMLAITDNRSAELADWDKEALAKALSSFDGFDLEQYGWNDEDIAKLTETPSGDDNEGEKGDKKRQKKSVRCPSCGKEFVP